MTKIYLVSNIDNDPNKVYIGKTKSSRESKHKLKYGHQITYTYIDEIYSLNREDWKPLETKWIQHYIDLGYDVVNKRKKGGSGPECWTEGQKIKHKKPRPGSGPKFRSESDKIKISLGNKGKPKPKNFNSHLCRPVLQYDLQGNFIKEWPSSLEASKHTNIKNCNIKNCYLGNCKTSGGFIWKLKNILNK